MMVLLEDHSKHPSVIILDRSTSDDLLHEALGGEQITSLAWKSNSKSQRKSWHGE